MITAKKATELTTHWMRVRAEIKKTLLEADVAVINACHNGRWSTTINIDPVIKDEITDALTNLGYHVVQEKSNLLEIRWDNND